LANGPILILCASIYIAVVVTFQSEKSYFGFVTQTNWALLVN